MTSIDVITPGKKVKFSEAPEIEALVVSVCISDNLGVSYQVVYWVGSERKEIWVKDIEIQQEQNKNQLRIGFTGRHE